MFGMNTHTHTHIHVSNIQHQKNFEGKHETVPVHILKAHTQAAEAQIQLFLTLVPDTGQLYTLGTLPPGMEPLVPLG